MAVTVSGIRLGNLEIKKDSDGRQEIHGSYELLTNNGIVLAKQNFNGYNDVKLNPSPITQKTLQDLIALITTDLNMTLGLG